MEIINNFFKNSFKKNIIFIIIIFIIIILSFLFKNNDFYKKNLFQEIKHVVIAGKTLIVELAITIEKQNLGLSNRKELKENKGMLFVFENNSEHFFWMKDMNFPIDIIWIDENLRVVYIKKDAKPESFPESYGAKIFAKYVLEVVSGFSDKNNLKVGDSISFLYF